MDSKIKVLVVEDEKPISRFIALELEHEGYEVDLAYDGREGLEMALKGDYSIIILDIMLPRINGIEVCQKLRKVKNTPIIMVTAKDDTSDKVIGLDCGADDYVTKPFEIEELLARIRSNLRKHSLTIPQKQTLSLGKLCFNLDMHSLSYDDIPIELTKKEYDLLKLLVDNKNMVLSREQILDKVWGYDFYGDTNVVDVYVRYIRSKVDEKHSIKTIHTIRGVGYVIKDER